MLRPINRRELIRRLRELGWHGPYQGKRHEYMLKDGQRIILPNPHGKDIDVNLLARILRQAGISREEWESTE